MSVTPVRATPADWWAATAEGRLLLLRCPTCGCTWLPWMPHCPEHGPTTEPETIESAGTGVLYSWVVIHYSVSEPDEVPFTVASVLLDEGAMIYGRVDVKSSADLVANARVTAEFVPRHGRTVVDFRLI
jgi:uncharacterized OB-fold protein